MEIQPRQVEIPIVQRILGRPLVVLERLQGEIVRKSLHLLIALVPFLASVSVPVTLSVLAAGTLFYTFAEASRRRGNPIFVVSDLTLIASREKDMGRFVLGPITLGLGAMLALILYPEPAASIAVFALAFGDGFAFLQEKIPKAALFLYPYAACFALLSNSGTIRKTRTSHWSRHGGSSSKAAFPSS